MNSFKFLEFFGAKILNFISNSASSMEETRCCFGVSQAIRKHFLIKVIQA